MSSPCRWGGRARAELGLSWSIELAELPHCLQDLSCALTYADGTVVSFSYDAAGNRTSMTAGGTTTAYTYNAASELTSAGSTAYSYDGAGNRLTAGSSSFGYDSVRGRDKVPADGRVEVSTLELM
jgi:uncharacterized protein RhaS with RHS repeats